MRDESRDLCIETRTIEEYSEHGSIMYFGILLSPKRVPFADAELWTRMAPYQHVVDLQNQAQELLNLVDDRNGTVVALESQLTAAQQRISEMATLMLLVNEAKDADELLAAASQIRSYVLRNVKPVSEQGNESPNE